MTPTEILAVRQQIESLEQQADRLKLESFLANSPESPRCPRRGSDGMDRRAVTMPSTTNAVGEEVDG